MRNKKYGVWTLLETITDATRNFAKVYENEVESSVNVFHECEIRILLKAGNAGVTTPIVYEATLIYEDNLKA